jgi:uncharacterized protein (TIGR02099 family)
MRRPGALLAWLVRSCLVLAFSALVLVAVYVSLGRELMPFVADYRAEVEAQARELGLPLQIGRLEARWRWLGPELLGHDLVLGEAGQSLQLKQLRVVPDLLQSLWQRRLQIARFELDGLQLELLQGEDGRWVLSGMPASDPDKPFDLQALLDASKRVKRIALLDSQLRLQPHGSEALTLSDVDLLLRLGARQRLDARLVLPDGQPLKLLLKTRLQAGNWQQSPAEVYLNLPQSDWAAWLPDGLSGKWDLQRLQAGGEFWLEWGAEGLQRAAGRLHARELGGAYQDRPALAVNDLAANLYFQRDALGYRLVLDGLAFSQGDSRWGETRLDLRHDAATDAGAERWQLSSARAELGPLTTLVTAWAPLPEQARDVLETLQPHGLLRNLQASWHPDQPLYQRLAFSANLAGVGISAWHGVPAVEGVSGLISGGIGAGELRLASEGFSLHLDKLFPEPWAYHKAGALLRWQLDEAAFSLSAPYLRVTGEEGELGGDFMIRLAKDPAVEDYMDLRVGLRDGDARFTGKYLPTRTPAMSAALSDWLQTAIQGGNIDEGWFQYQGSVQRDATPESRSISLFFKVHDAQLAFQPGWPVLRGARADVFIEDSGIRVRAPEGQLLNSQVSDVAVDIPLAGGKPPRLKLQGKLASNLADALQLLTEAPIGTAPIFAGWSGEGDLDGRLQLDLPLQKGGAAPHVVVDFRAVDARLNIAEPALNLEQLTGNFRYDTHLGLSAPQIRARVFGEAVQGRALAQGSKGQARSRLEVNGKVKWPILAKWLGLTQPLPLSGELPYRLALILDGLDSQLTVDSTLKGLAVDLPEPFGKAGDAVRDSQLRMSLGGAQRRYGFDYAKRAQLALAAPAGDLLKARGELRLGGGRAGLPTTQGLRLRGQVKSLDWNAWLAVAQQYVPAGDAQTQRLFQGAELEIGEFLGFGQRIDNLSVSLTPSGSGWHLLLDSATVKGRAGLPGATGAPIDIDLSYLKLPAKSTIEPDPAQPPVDPLAAVDPRQVPAMDVRIRQLWQGQEPIGAWSFKTRPTGVGVNFNELNLDLRGLQLSGSAGWEGEPGASRSWYRGRLDGKDLAEVLLAWGFAPTASSESFGLDVNGNWPGSPAGMSLKRFSGTLDGSLRSGQFTEVQGTASALRVFGLLNFNAIGRRLRLDFSDLFDRGLSYDRFKVNLMSTDGVYSTIEPITMTGPSSSFELEGSLDMVEDQINAKLLVSLPVSNNLPLAALIVGAPAVGGALYVVDKLLGDRVARFASVQYDVSGSLSEPRFNFDRPFEKRH